MSNPVDIKDNFDVGCSLSDEQKAMVSEAMDCIGWLSVHGFTMTFLPEGLQIEPEFVPDPVLEKLAQAGPAFRLLFPNHLNEVGRVLGGIRGSSC